MSKYDTFWSKVDIKSENECWNWLASIGNNGRGSFRINKAGYIASRFAWEITYGIIPDGLQCFNTCGNILCVNPKHLFVCSRKEWNSLHVEKRFWEKVDKRSDSECWNWVGGINSTGRGIIGINGESIHAHRFSWTLHNGDIPDGFWVLHHCDNGKCVNPKHLFLGTPKDNVQDMINKGRKVTLRGEKDPKSILKRDEVIMIRKLYTPYGKYSQHKLAKMFGVSRSAIQNVLERRNWKHVE